MKIDSENRFSGKTYFYTIASDQGGHALLPPELQLLHRAVLLHVPPRAQRPRPHGQDQAVGAAGRQFNSIKIIWAIF